MTPEEITSHLAGAAAGDRDHFEALVAEFAGLAWSVARAHRLSHADAEDVVQTVWLRLSEHLDRIKEPGRLAGWLATTARHEALSVARRGSRTISVPETEALGYLPDPAAELLRGEHADAVRRAFASLPALCQALLRLIFADPPVAYSDIAEALGRPIGSLGPTRQRCLSRLRRHPAILGIS